jgi:hypothetical protein
MLDSLVRVSRRAGWAALCYRRGREQAAAREVPAPTTPVGPRRNESATTTRDGTLARGTSALSTEVGSAGLFRFQDRRAVGPSHQGSAALRGGSRARSRAFGRHPTGRGVLLGEKCATPPAREPPTRAPRENRTSRERGFTQRRRAAGGRNTESPRSTFRAPPVYP